MKKTLLTIGIGLLVLGVLSLLVSLFFRWSYYSVLDGSSELYMRLDRNKTIFLFIGLALAVSGITVLIVRHLKK